MARKAKRAKKRQTTERHASRGVALAKIKPWEQVFDDAELLACILSHLQGVHLAVPACVSRHWRATAALLSPPVAHVWRLEDSFTYRHMPLVQPAPDPVVLTSGAVTCGPHGAADVDLGKLPWKRRREAQRARPQRHRQNCNVHCPHVQLRSTPAVKEGSTSCDQFIQFRVTCAGPRPILPVPGRTWASVTREPHTCDQCGRGPLHAPAPLPGALHLALCGQNSLAGDLFAEGSRAYEGLPCGTRLGVLVHVNAHDRHLWYRFFLNGEPQGRPESMDKIEAIAKPVSTSMDLRGREKILPTILIPILPMKTPRHL